jgi:hypothetical protein
VAGDLVAQGRSAERRRVAEVLRQRRGGALSHVAGRATRRLARAQRHDVAPCGAERDDAVEDRHHLERRDIGAR